MGRTLQDLQQKQALPLEVKLRLTQARIVEWYRHNDGKVYVSFSGGKDSTVLLHLVRELFPEVPAVFSNTGLEYPEIRRFVHSFDNVVEIYPTWAASIAKKYGKEPGSRITFLDTLRRVGYPLISKEIALRVRMARHGDEHSLAGFKGENRRKDGELSQFNFKKYGPLLDLPLLISDRCCEISKKSPMHKHERKTQSHAFVGTMAAESRLRTEAWLRNGCNAFEAKHPTSMPMAFWTEQDVLHYILENSIKICSVYGDICYKDEDGFLYNASIFPVTRDMELCCSGCSRTGCIYCPFGMHLEKGETRFQRLKRTHPRQYDYCLSGGGWEDNPNYDPAKGADEWNPKQLWMPNKSGLGMAKVFDMINDIYGKSFYRYE